MVISGMPEINKAKKLANLFLEDKESRKNWTTRQLLEKGTDYFRLAGFEEPKNEARWLLFHLLKIKISDFYTHPDQPIAVHKLEQVFAGLARRLRREPAAYIVGYADFYGREFSVGPGVLIPRPDTEVLVYHVLKLSENISGPIKILDTCTGSACIGITIALELIKSGKEILLDLVDIDEQALSYAQKNLSFFKLEKIARCHIADLWPRHDRWDIITANPPYVVSSVFPELQHEITEYEPVLALDGGNDGLDFYRRLTKETVAYAQEGCILALEHGYDQANQVKSLLQANHWYDIIQLKDFGGHLRVTSGRI